MRFNLFNKQIFIYFSKKLKHYTKINNYKNKIKKYKKNFIIFKNNFIKSSKIELKETLIMIKIIIKRKSKKEDYYKRYKQFKDLIKISSILPIIILPGSPITLPLLYKLRKKFNIDLTPSSFKHNFSKLGIEVNERNIKIANQLLENNLEISQKNFKLFKTIKKQRLEFNEETIKLFLNKY